MTPCYPAAESLSAQLPPPLSPHADDRSTKILKSARPHLPEHDWVNLAEQHSSCGEAKALIANTS